MDAGRTDRIVDHGRWVTDAWPPGWPVRESRDAMSAQDLARDERDQLAELDAILIEAALTGDVVDELLDDDSTQPLQRWWWHLGAIRSGTYPLDLLPEPLRAVYRASSEQAN